MKSAPEFSLPAHLDGRPIDVLGVGSLVLELIVKIPRWPQPGGQDVIRASSLATSAGGCAVNVTCYASRLGANTAIVSTVGDGKYGQEVLAELVKSCVSVEYLKRYVASDGSIIIILSGPDGDWTTLEHMDRSFTLETEDLPAEAEFAKVKFVHVDGFSFTTAGSKTMVDEAVRRAKSAGCLVSVDSSVPAAKTEGAYLASLFQRADILFANLFEIMTVTETATVGGAIRAIQQMRPKVGVIKMGSEGSYVLAAGEVAKLSAFPVDVVDTVAAGDAYVGATLAALCQGLPLVRAAKLGSAAGALACLGAGSLSSRFSIQDVEALIRKSRSTASLK